MTSERAVVTPAERLAEVMRSGRFVLTAELESPRNGVAAGVERQARALGAYVDAVNCTDNAAAIVRMSPVAVAALVARAGLAPLVQLTCRDRNRITLQSEALGAAAVGAAGIVCMTGDPPGTGNHPDAKAVFDITSIELMAAIRGLTQGHFMSGDPIDRPPSLLVGCVENPGDGEKSIGRFAAKIDAGAEFTQTQIVFDVEAFASWMELVRSEGLHQRARILAGIAPVRRPRTAHDLNVHVPGVTVPPAVLERLDSATDPEEEGVQVAAEMLRAIRDVPGVAGAHLFSFGWIDGIRRLVDLI
jgi:methylenetetrahydrofolate reductase (NADPH)